jgi:serine/threonine protein kinase
MPTLTIAAGAEPIPGYRLLELLGRGSFGEVWKCEAPGGLLKAIKLIGAEDCVFEDRESLNKVKQELQALDRVKAIRHPFLLSIERIEVRDGELVIVTELADESLQDVFERLKNEGQPGIPRAELLSYLTEAAEVLDVMNLRHQLQHLDIKPGNIFLVDQHIKVGDFGLVRVLGDARGSDQEQQAGVTPAYCAPETLRGAITTWTDQYSLAIVYQELLTGRLPFKAKNVRKLLFERLTAEPDLSALPNQDRAIVARALAREPERRFPSCSDFIRALRPTSSDRLSRPRLPVLKPESEPLPEQATVNLRLKSESFSAAAHGTAVSSETSPLLDHHAPTEVAPLPGYRFLTCLGCEPLSEVWEVETAEGVRKYAKLIFGVKDVTESGASEMIRQLQALRHPALMPISAVQAPTGRLFILSDPADSTLWQLFRDYQDQGLPGIPREELVSHLESAAEALGEIAQRAQIQHLGLNPGNLLMHGGRLLIADHGIAQYLWLPSGQSLAQSNQRYAPPELFDRRVSPFCDQYSLALIGHHMLTGQHPWPMQSVQRLRAGRWQVKLAESALSDGDRRVFARALQVDPAQRFPSCAAFVEALRSAAREHAAQARQRATTRPPVISIDSSAGLTTIPLTAEPPGDAAHVVDEWKRFALGRKQLRRAEDMYYLVEPGVQLEATFSAQWPAALARAKVEGFRKEWQAELVQAQDQSFLLWVPVAATTWQRWLNRRPALQVQIDLLPVGDADPSMTRLSVQVRPVECNARQNLNLLEEVGPALLRVLRRYLLTLPEQGADPQLPFAHPVTLFPVSKDLSLGEPISGEGEEISSTGLALTLGQKPPSNECYVHVPAAPATSAIAVFATLLHIQKRTDGKYDAALQFVAPPDKSNGSADSETKE